MRNLHTLDRFRSTNARTLAWYGSVGDHQAGVFVVPSPVDRALMTVIASSDGGWEHVSVSRQNRCPNWPEMDHVKRLFFEDHETAMQLHVAVEQHISHHPHCLHLWRPLLREISLPPSEFV